MKINIPKKIFGREIEGAIERSLRGSSSSNTSVNPQPVFNPTPSNVRNSQNYLILEGKSYGTYSYPDLIVSMERTHQDKNWDDAHKYLSNQAEFMLNMRQFVDFLNLLKSGKAFDGSGRQISSSQLDSLYKEITEVRNPWRAEWLDAKFEIVNKSKKILYGHRVTNGNLTAQKSEDLLSYINRDKEPGIDLDEWLSKANHQGLPIPQTKKGDLYYWHPRNGSVARFYADSNGAGLYCDGDPSDSDSALGVRAAREKI